MKTYPIEKRRWRSSGLSLLEVSEPGELPLVASWGREGDVVHLAEAGREDAG